MSNSDKDSIPLETTCAAVKELLDTRIDFLLLDCREPDEHELVKIDGSTLLPMGQLSDRLGELESHRQRHIIVHCHHGVRSLRVANWLKDQGFIMVQSMAGGIDAWAQEIDPSINRY